jgi:outer membrane protein assembly factor BamB/tetratricopeptide (TPR) repeat protein
MKELVRVVENIARKEALGTLILGRGGKSVEFFFENNLIFLAAPGYCEKIDVDGLVNSGLLGSKISGATIESLSQSADLKTTTVPEVLRARGLIDDAQFSSLAERHLQEEVFSRAVESAETFQFQEGHVPESLIDKPSLSTSFPVSAQRFLDLVRSRWEHCIENRQVLPSGEEIFVISEKGLAQRQKNDLEYGIQRILDLIDGFRTLEAIIDLSQPFRFQVECRLVQLLHDGFIKKTVLPEIQSFNPNIVNQEEMLRYLPIFRSAIKFAADELKARENYAAFAERVGKNDEAVEQYHFLGDAYSQMGRRSIALKAFQKALALLRNSPVIADKLVRLYRQSAEEALAQGSVGEAVSLYKKALDCMPGHQEVFAALLEIYVRENRLNEVVEMCDCLINSPQHQADSAFAIATLEGLSAKLRDQPLFHKKLINLYLDNGRKREAADVMELLARYYLETGHAPQAQELIDKVLRLDPNRKELRKLARVAGKGEKQVKPRRRPRRKMLPRFSLAAVALVLGYQAWALVAYLHLSQHRELIAEASMPPPPEMREAIAESSTETRLRELAIEAGAYKGRYPLSVFRFQAVELRRQFEEAAVQMERMRNHLKKKLLEEGRAQILLGNEARAMAKLNPLLALDPEDTWRRQAEEEIRRFKLSETDAQEIRKQVDEATAAKDFVRAHELIARLISQAPSSKALRGLLYPIELRVVPSRLQERLKDVPASVKLSPTGSKQIKAQVDGFEPLEVTIRPGLGPLQFLAFHQTPAWVRSMGPCSSHPIEILDDRILYLDAHGDIHALDARSGQPVWSHPTPSLITPSAPMLLDPPHLLVAYNDGRIRKFRIDGDGKEAGRLAVDGFVQTSLIALKSRGVVAFGTSRGNIVLWSQKASGEAETVGLPEPLIHLVARGDDALIAHGSSGTLYCLELDARGLAWKRPVGKKLLQAPAVVGPAGSERVVLINADSDVTAIDARSGEARWVRPAPPSSSTVAVLGRSSRVLIIEGLERVVEIDAATGNEIGVRRVAGDLSSFERLVDLSRGLGSFSPEGAFVILDPASLEPLWVYRVAGKRQQAAAHNDLYTVLVDQDGVLRGFRHPQE